MILKSTAAIDGFKWFQQGIGTFYENYKLVLSILLGYLTCLSLLSSIPYIGKIMSFMLTATSSCIFFIAGQDAHIYQKAKLGRILNAFWKDFSVTWAKLMLLGFISFLFTHMGSTLVYNLTNNYFSENIFLHGKNYQLDYSLLFTISLITIILIPGNVLLWFSPILILWEKISIAQAFFYSTITLWKNFSASLIFTICWICSAFILILLSWGTKLIGLDTVLMPTVLFLGSVILLGAFYSSLYATYQGCFEKPINNKLFDSPLDR